MTPHTPSPRSPTALSGSVGRRRSDRGTLSRSRSRSRTRARGALAPRLLAPVLVLVCLAEIADSAILRAVEPGSRFAPLPLPNESPAEVAAGDGPPPPSQVPGGAPIEPDRGAAGNSPSPAPRPASPAADRDEVGRFLESRYQEARRAYQAGSFHIAWQIAEAILVLSPDVPFREELRRLRRDAQGRYLAQSVVVVTFVPDGVPTFPVTVLRGDVVIENHSREAITVGSQEKEPVLGLAHFRVSSLPEESIGETAQEGTRVVRMPGEFRIEPGAVHRLPVEIAVPPAPEGALLIQRWTVDGVLRPITVRVGKELLTRGVPWIAASGALLPPELAEIGREPLAELRQALLTGDRRRFVAASSLWCAEAEQEEGGAASSPEREQLIDELLGCLGRFDGELDLPAIRLLEELTGEVRERTTQSWQIWGLTRARPVPRGEER